MVRKVIFTLMVTALQILFVLLLIVIAILFAFQPRKRALTHLPHNYKELLQDYVRFYIQLDEEHKKKFEQRLEKFLSGVKITGANAEVEDLDLVLIASAALIPVFRIPDWEYINLREVLVYPGNFNTDFEQHGSERMITGMVGSGPLQDVMIINKWDTRQGFINGTGNRNTAIHEFVHLVDKMDGTLDGVPEIILERKFLPLWKQLLEQTMERVRNGQSDIDPYAATSPVECFAVIAEYFFMQPEAFAANHPELDEMMKSIFHRMPVSLQGG